MRRFKQDRPGAHRGRWCGLKPGVENIWGVGGRTGMPVGGWVL